MIPTSPLPRLPVSWREFSNLLKASQPKADKHEENQRVKPIPESMDKNSAAKLNDQKSSWPDKQTKETQLKLEGMDPIRDAIHQIRNGLPRSLPMGKMTEDGIDVYA